MKRFSFDINTIKESSSYGNDRPERDEMGLGIIIGLAIVLPVVLFSLIIVGIVFLVICLRRRNKRLREQNNMIVKNDSER